MKSSKRIGLAHYVHDSRRPELHRGLRIRTKQLTARAGGKYYLTNHYALLGATMATADLKLPDELKRRIAQLVAGSGRSAHSFMVEAIEQAAQREELRRRFGEEAARPEGEARESGKVYNAANAFDHLEAHAQVTRARQPRMKSW